MLTKYTYYKLIITAFLILSCHKINAQTESLNGNTETFQSWTAWLGIDTDYEVAKNLNLSLRNQFRYDENLTSFKSYFTEIGATYKLDDLIKKRRERKDLDKVKYSVRLGASYRYVVRDRYSQNGQRLSLVATVKPYIKQLNDIVDISFRTKFQHDYTWNRQRKRTLLRGKMSLKFPQEIKVKKNDSDKKQKLDLTPFFSTEYFYQFHYKGNVPYRIRFQSGLDFELPNRFLESSSKRYLTFKYVFQRSLSSNIPEDDHIIALLYSFSF